MHIRDRVEYDPVLDLGMPNNYMRWALEAIEEVGGKNGLAIILRDAGLDRLQYTPPPDNDAFEGFTSAHYASLTTAILSFFGRAAESMTMRVGRISARRAITQQAQLFNVPALLAEKDRPLDAQFRVGLKTIQEGIRKLWAAHGQGSVLTLEETEDAWLYVNETCPECAGKASDTPMCWLFVGVLRETTRWFTGRDFGIVETKCRALGAPACVWQIGKTPLAE